MPLRLLGHKSTLSFKMNYSDLSSNQSEADNMTAQDSNQPPETDGPPPLPLDLHEHKLQIFLNWGFILLTSCIVPLVLYPSLHWGANLSIKICLSPNLLLSMSDGLTISLLKCSPECSQRHTWSDDLIFAGHANMATILTDIELPTA